jgi:REP-associated tyrosine transposase
VGRRTRSPFEREFVHAYTRGNNRAQIYFDEFDYVAWLRLVDRTVARFGWTCHAFCLMPNHYHLLLETSQPRLSAGMRHLNGSFAQRVNRRYDGTGHVFEGPYRIELVEEESHLLELCRYIPLNPVRACLVHRAEDWLWSSFRATAGLEHAPPFLRTSFVRSLFGRGALAVTAYREFVRAGESAVVATSRDQVPGRGGFGQKRLRSDRSGARRASGAGGSAPV